VGAVRPADMVAALAEVAVRATIATRAAVNKVFIRSFIFMIYSCVIK
jgi:hypothetical protein